jgi:hypothetical protein
LAAERDWGNLGSQPNRHEEKPMSQQERRRHVRLPKEAVTTCQEITYPLGAKPEVEIRMVDVSAAGVGFEAPRPFALGLPIQIALVLQGWHRHTSGFLKYDETALSKPLTAVGRVVRCNPLDAGGYEVGVEFVDIWEDHWRAMRTYLQKEVARSE